MREAYSEVFTVNQKAHSLSTTDLQGIFARLSDKGEAVNRKMATTFKTLAELAVWDAAGAPAQEAPGAAEEQEHPPPDGRTEVDELPERRERAIVVHHDVHIHLPVSTEIAVYDAIFRSLRENLR